MFHYMLYVCTQASYLALHSEIILLKYVYTSSNSMSMYYGMYVMSYVGVKASGINKLLFTCIIYTYRIAW